MKCDKKTLLLYAVTDRSYSALSLHEHVEQALSGGVSCVQLREKHLAYSEFLKEAVDICKLCHSYGVPFIVNDNIDIALKCKADGVHIGQHDMKASEVRKKIGSGLILGVSAQTVEQAIKAEKDGADYLGTGAVFPTKTKDDADSVSPEALREICKSVSIPVVAIGGISEDNLLSLKGSGIAGVALVSAIFASDDIQKQCEKLKKMSYEAVNG